MKIKYIIIGAVILIGLLIFANKKGWIGKGNKTKVAITDVQELVVVETVSASGKIEPEIQVKLSPEVSGEIVELLVKEGDIVKKGQLLCRIKPDILASGYERTVASYNAQKAAVGSAQQQIIQAEANYKNVESRYKRNETLYKEKVLSTAEFDAAKADYLTAKANLESAKQSLIGAKFGLEQSGAGVKEARDNLARTNIYAPVDGVVSKLSVEQGERVVGTAQMSGTEIMTIANLSSMLVNVEVNENDINRLSLNDTATIVVDAFLDKKFVGVVTEIGSSAKVSGQSTDEVTNFEVKVRILPSSYQAIKVNGSSLPSPFRPGLSATVDIKTNSVKNLAVPIQAVTVREEEQEKSDKKEEKESVNKDLGKEYVFVLEGNIVKQIAVTTSIQDDNNIIIIKGLKKAQKVVSAPYAAISKILTDGMEVEVVDKKDVYATDK